MLKTTTIALATVLAIATQVQAAAPEARTIEGTWRGQLGTPPRALPLVFTLFRAGAGWSAVLESPAQGATLAVDAVTWTGERVRLEVKRVGGVFEGALGKGDAELTGSWSQTGVPPQPLVLTREAAPAPVADAGPPPLDAPIDVVVPVPPTPMRGSDGKTHLVYELHVTNLSKRPLALERVEVLGDRGAVLAKHEGLDLFGRLARPGAADAVGLGKLRLGPGLRAVVFLWVTPEGPLPATLEHRITVGAGTAAPLVVTCARVPVRAGGLVLSPPFKGTRWLAANGPSNTSGHRRTLIPVGGRATISQRFAIDWVRQGADGKTFTGSGKENRDYLAWGTEALAVADAVVSRVKDGIPENTGGPASRAVPMTLETIGGNHVILDLGNGRFAFYAHLQPGSIRVKPGDKVRRGQLLGLVGNSGNSTEPHLHFHVADANAPLAAEGLPYAIDALKGTLPLEDTVVDF